MSAANNDDGTGCMVIFVVIISLVGSFIQWLSKTLLPIWMKIKVFLSNFWAVFIEHLPMIGLVVLGIFGLYFSVRLVSLIISKIAEINRTKKAEEVAREKARAWRESKEGQNVIQSREVYQKLKMVKTLRKALIEKRQKHMAYVNEMQRSLSAYPTLEKARFENHIRVAMHIVEDLNQQERLCDGYINELNIRLRDLEREKKSLQHYGSMKGFSEQFAGRFEMLKDVERFLSNYYIKTYSGEDALTLSAFDLDRIDLLKEEATMRRGVEQHENEKPLDLNEFNTAHREALSAEKIRRDDTGSFSGWTTNIT